MAYLPRYRITSSSALDVRDGIAALFLFAAALAIRLPGFDGRPLWNDEIWRALLILDPQFWHAFFFAPTVETAITSPLYAIVVKTAAAIFGGSPGTLRLASFIPGVLAAPMGFALIRKAGGGIVLSVFAGLCFVLSRNFAAYSNEMKPYMFEVFIHLVCVYVWLSLIMAARPTPRAWSVFFLVMIVAVLSTPTAIFLLPAAGLTLGARTLADRDIKAMTVCVLVFAGIAAVVGALYIISWRYGASDGMLSVWADGFPANGESSFHFLVTHAGAIWMTAFALPYQGVLATALLLITLCWFIVTRSVLKAPVRDFLIFYLVFLATLCLINALRIWPFGALRANLFIYAHCIIFLFLLAAQTFRARIADWLGLAFAAVAVMITASSQTGREIGAYLMNGLQNLAGPLQQSDLVLAALSAQGDIGRGVAADCAHSRTPLIGSGQIDLAVTYYTRYDPTPRPGLAVLKGPCVRYSTFNDADAHPGEARTVISQAMNGAQHAWILYAFLDEKGLAALRRVAGNYGHLGRSRNFALAGYFELIAGPPQRQQ